MDKSKSHRLVIPLIFIILCFYSVIATLVAHVHELPTAYLAAICFSAVIAAALLISWAAETGQFLMSQGLAVAIVAVLQVLPEFMVEAAIAQKAGQAYHELSDFRDSGIPDKEKMELLKGEWAERADLMLANATGSNRLLMGVGWTLIYFTAVISSLRKKTGRIKEIRFREEFSVEIVTLLVASLYFCKVVFISKCLSLIDSVVLTAIFVWYMWVLKRLPPETEETKEDLFPMSRYLVDIRPEVLKRVSVVMLFVVGGVTMLFIAHPFVEGMRGVAEHFGITAFIFVQWCAPFLSEFPEKVTAFYWASGVRLAPMAFLNMVSSKVNQWTALFAMLPIVYSLYGGEILAVPLDQHHLEEVFLSLIMTAYGCLCLAKFRYTFLDACVMFGLWLFQFLWPHNFPGGEAIGKWLSGVLGFGIVMPNTRIFTSACFGVAMILQAIFHRREYHLWSAFRNTLRKMRRGKSNSRHTSHS